MDLIDTGDLLAVPHNIDYSAVAAASDDNQTSIGFINQHSFISDVIRGLLGIFNNAVGFWGCYLDFTRPDESLTDLHRGSGQFHGVARVIHFRR
ncbi:hypothetical protein D3C80_1544330 [compost metagenome]